jgi:hypothetical protein
MSKIEVNAVEPQCGTNLTLGASGDTIIIPSGATISNQGTAAGFGPTGAVSWNTTKITADPNPAVTGVGYFADTTSAAFTITLPSSPSAGAVVGIADYANTFATNNITVARNGSNIGGAAENATLFTNGVSVTFVYVDATQGWIVTDSGNRSDLLTPEYIVASGGTVTCCGDYKIHTFTGPGTFTVTSAGNPLGSETVDYMVVAGGGGGGSGCRSGGGGAGGFRESSGAASGCYTASPLGSGVSALPVSAQGYPITVGGSGAGGVPGSPPTLQGTNGGNSIFSTITSVGGGGGGAFDGPGAPPTAGVGSPGGSGGGGWHSNKNGGTGNTPPVSPPQGQNGGNGVVVTNAGSGGGGGAGAAGGNGVGTVPGQGGPGGNGVTSSINASPVTRAGGGGGGGDAGAKPGGTGGGGAAGNPGVAGTINTGSGGGGTTTSGPSTQGGAGGSGIVIIRYKFQ